MLKHFHLKRLLQYIFVAILFILVFTFIVYTKNNKNDEVKRALMLQGNYKNAILIKNNEFDNVKNKIKKAKNHHDKLVKYEDKLKKYDFNNDDLKIQLKNFITKFNKLYLKDNIFLEFKNSNRSNKYINVANVEFRLVNNISLKDVKLKIELTSIVMNDVVKYLDSYSEILKIKKNSLVVDGASIKYKFLYK